MKQQEQRPALVISLDFELHWGVTERVTEPNHPYSANLYGARKVIPRLLTLFQKHGIHATWATVGMLFARGREDLETFKPATRPAYEKVTVDTYRVSVGESEQADPLHFAPGLIQKIRAMPGQEVACHTFCHYYCDEPKQDIETFKADLAAAQAIASRDNVELKSLVFPRNQILADYLPVVQEAGLASYRGNPPGAMYHLPASGIRRHAVRVIRLLDSFINLTGHHSIPWSHVAADKALADVRASHFLRPYNRKFKILEPLRRLRVKAGMRFAARRGEIYHIWWHPHNFGANLEKNLEALEEILEEFEKLRSRYGMQSLTMNEAAERARG